MRLELRFNAQSLLDRLDGMEAFAADPKAALSDSADLFFTKIEPRYFRSAQWTPLKPDSVRRKRRLNRPLRPLAGGSLEKSLTVKGARYQVRRINKMSVTVGTRHPLASIHDKGTRGALPRRPLISVSQGDRDQIRSIFARHWMQARGRQIHSLRRSFL